MNRSNDQIFYTEKFKLKLILSDKQCYIDDMLNLSLNNVENGYIKSLFVENVINERYLRKFFSNYESSIFCPSRKLYIYLIVAIYLEDVNIGFFSFNQEGIEYNLGMFIDKKYSNKGYATDIVKTVLNIFKNNFNHVNGYDIHVYGFIPRRKIIWVCGENNFPSIKIAHKLGFTEKTEKIINNKLFVKFEITV